MEEAMVRGCGSERTELVEGTDSCLENSTSPSLTQSHRLDWLFPVFNALCGPYMFAVRHDSMPFPTQIPSVGSNVAPSSSRQPWGHHALHT